MQSEGPSNISERLRRIVEPVFGIDPRSGALFRVLISVVVLVDLAIRSTALREHYTDAGVLPRDLLIESYGNAAAWSIHMLGGGLASVALLFIAHAIAAIGLLVGWRTRLMTVIVWVMAASLKARNPWVSNAGDMILVLMLFWSMFVPLGACWSVDAMQRRSRGLTGDAPDADASGASPVRAMLSFGTVGLILQLFIMYWVTGYWKMNEVWSSGQAMERVASLDLYTTAIGQWLAGREGASGMLHIVSVITPWLEMGAPTVCLIPIGTRWIRLAAIVVMVGFHLGIELTIHTGMLQWVVIVAWTLLLPAAFWDRLGAVRWAVGRIGGAVERPMAALARSLPAASGPSPTVARRAGVAMNVVAAALLVWCAVWYVQLYRAGDTTKTQQFTIAAGLVDPDADKPQPLARALGGMAPSPEDALPLAWVGKLTGLATNWKMFARPMVRDGWYLIVGTLKDGTTINLLDDGKPFDPTEYVKPDVPASMFPNHRWRKYYVNIAEEGWDRQRIPLAGVLCRSWNRSHPDEPIEDLLIGFIEEPFTPTGPQKHRRLLFFKGPCPRPTDILLTKPLAPPDPSGI